MCVANDDVASAPKAVKEQRHGIAGGFFMWKVGEARAAKGGSLDDVIASSPKCSQPHKKHLCWIGTMCDPGIRTFKF